MTNMVEERVKKTLSAYYEAWSTITDWKKEYGHSSVADTIELIVGAFESSRAAGSYLPKEV